MRHRKHASPAALSVLVLLVATLGFGSSSVPVDHSYSSSATNDLNEIGESVGYLSHAYQVSNAEAVRRLRLGADSAALAERLAGSLPQEYAGMWLDQQGGGVLMVASTNTVHADQVIRGLPHRDELRTTPARYSLAELERIRDRVRAAVGDLASAQVDVLGNRVEVWTGQPDRVRRALSGAAPAGAVAVRPVPAVTPTACPTVFDCGPPMRGGISVELGNANKEPMGTYCTSAFNIRDGRKNFYAMTAGHCFKLRPAAFYLINPRNDSVISERNSTRAAILDQRSPRVDFAITPIVNPDRWMPSGKRRNGVFMECSAEPMPNPCAGPRKSRYPITGMKNYGDMIIGEVVCMAGASPLTGAVKPGTRCGQITAKPDGAIQTNICAKLGDSGSPLFDQTTHTAYGVESGLAAGQVTGKCDPFDQVQTLYTPLSVILDTANQLTGVDYRLITNRDGD